MIKQLSKVTYPSLFIDIGTSRIPKSFDDDGNIRDIQILECIMSYIESSKSEPEQSNVTYFDIQDSTDPMREFITTFNKYTESSCILVAHNAETDIKLIRGMATRLGMEIASDIKTYCTMLNGVPYSKTHVYRGGKKVKKYPHLQELYRSLTGYDCGKGDIIDDLMMCFECYKCLEEREMEA